jgi:RimJ/RimL family protein N-acetyltransferase
MPSDPPLGERINWTPARRPQRESLRGEHALLRTLDPVSDAEPLFAVSHPPHGDEAIWTYLPDGPYRDVEQLREMLASAQISHDPFYFAIVPRDDQRDEPRENQRDSQPPLGWASYMRITPESGTIEIGHIWFARELQRSTAATEAIYLLIEHAFDELGYRRVEWKCNALNAPSRQAAERFGFTFEGVFRKHQIVKGRNRDTAWFSIVDDEWPAIRAGFESWLSAENFDAGGVQVRPLAQLIAAERAQAA